MNQSIYDFSALSLNGKEVSLSDFKGKTLLIVNTASKCGFTPQFEGLEDIYKKYQESGFVVLGFPSNQFANQEPGDEKSIAEGCVLNYGVSFPMFSKIDVNGPNTHPLYTYLKNELHGLSGKNIKWNFTKFLIDSDGNPLKRFSPSTTPEKIELYLQKNGLVAYTQE
jgi:glutathione peroxidase